MASCLLPLGRARVGRGAFSASEHPGGRHVQCYVSLSAHHTRCPRRSPPALSASSRSPPATRRCGRARSCRILPPLASRGSCLHPFFLRRRGLGEGSDAVWFPTSALDSIGKVSINRHHALFPDNAATSATLASSAAQPRDNGAHDQSLLQACTAPRILRCAFRRSVKRPLAVTTLVSLFHGFTSSGAGWERAAS